MGAFRLYITILIIIGHMGLWENYYIPFLSEEPASGYLQAAAKMHAFFLQAGFLSQIMFLRTPLNEVRVLSYYKHRYLSIFPQYHLFLIITSGVFCILGITHYSGISSYAALLDERGIGWPEAIFSNITALNLPSFAWSEDIHNRPMGYLFLPMTWTLTLQSCFVLLAPFILINKNRLLLMTAVSTVMLIKCYLQDIDRHLVPTEFAYYWYGALAALTAQSLYSILSRRTLVRSACILIPILVIVTLFYTHVEMMLGKWIMLAIYTLLQLITMIPLYFLTRNNAWDRCLSKVSYTMFLSQFLIVYLVREMGAPMMISAYMVVFVAILLGFLFHWNEFKKSIR